MDFRGRIEGEEGVFSENIDRDFCSNGSEKEGKIRDSVDRGQMEKEKQVEEEVEIPHVKIKKVPREKETG